MKAWLRSKLPNGVLGRVPRWSAINTLGKSWAVSFTALVPFLGSVLLFNQALVDALKLTGLFDGEAGLLARLYYIYFGLTLIGLASFGFALLCPRDVKTYGSVSRYIEEERPLLSPARMALLVDAVSDDFLAHEDDNLSRRQLAAYPQHLREFFYRVIERGVAEMDTFEDSIFDGSQFHNGAGYLNYDSIAEAIKSGRAVTRIISQNFADNALKEPGDYFQLRFMAMDHSKPIWRLVIGSFYAIGFAILLIPTFQTFWTITTHLFKRS